MNSKGLGRILIIIFVLLMILVGTYLYMDMRRSIKLHATYNYPTLLARDEIISPLIDQNEVIESSKSAQIQPPEGWQSYTNSIDGYSFLYPSDWHVLTCSNGYYQGNVHISSKPIEEKKCVGEKMEDVVQAEISIFASYDRSVDKILESARQEMGFIADFLEKSTEINGKTYHQMLFKLKIIPPWLIPSTVGVTTFIEVPERQEIINVALTGLDDDSQNADIYRQVIYSFKILDTPKPVDYPKF